MKVGDLERLEVSYLSAMQKSTVDFVYKMMVDNDLIGIPIVDNNHTFLGIVTQEKIAQEVIMQLLGNKASTEPKK